MAALISAVCICMCQEGADLLRWELSQERRGFECVQKQYVVPFRQEFFQNASDLKLSEFPFKG